MWNTVCIATMLSCFWTIGAPLWAQDIAEQLQGARKFYNDKKYQEAADALETLCKSQLDQADAYRLLGHAYYQLGRKDDARKTFARAVAHGRLTPDVLGWLARIDQQQAQTIGLLAGLRLRMLIDPNDHAWQLLYADVLAVVGASDEAEYVYQAIVRTDPARADVFLRLGNLYLQKKKYMQAVSAFETAYHLGAANPRLPRMIADLWFNAGDRQQALLWYDRTLDIQDDSAQNVRLRRAELLFRTGDLDQAEAASRLLINSTDHDLAGRAFLLLGQIAMRRKQPERAVRHWQRAVQAGVAEPQILAYLGSYYFNKGQYSQAAGYLGKRLAHGTPDKALLRYLIISLIRSGEIKRAGNELKTYLEYFGLDDEAEYLISSLSEKTTAEKK